MTNVKSSMAESSQTVSEGKTVMETLHVHMNDIHQKIDNVSRDTTSISEALVEQSETSQEIARQIANVSESSNKSLTDTEAIVDVMNNIETVISGQIANYANIELPGKVVKLAKSDHVIWKKRLANMIIGREGLNANELADHHSCRLGKWYDKVDIPEYLNNPAFKALVEPHRLVHHHGVEAVRFFNAGQIDQALGEIEKVEVASREVLKLLSDLEK